MNKTISGIYCIRFEDQFYVGQSVDIRRRLRKHNSQLLGNKHPNIRLSNSYNRHGADMFSFEVIETCNLASLTTNEQKILLNSLEQKWMDILDCYQSGFNCTKFAGRTNLGLKFKWSEESKQKLSAAKTGTKASDEARVNMCKAQQERYAEMSEEEKRNLNRGSGMLGKHHSNNTKKKISESNKGKNKTGHQHSDESKLKISVGNTGKKRGPGSREVKGYSKYGEYYCARIRINKTTIQLGKFLTPDEAHEAFVIAKRQYNSDWYDLSNGVDKTSNDG